MGKREKILTCEKCGKTFTDEDAERSCGNCFCCTGCEIYICPYCKAEVIVIPFNSNKK